MKIIVVEDNLNIRNYLLEVISGIGIECKVVAVAGSVAEAVPLINLYAPDLILLDVELPDGTGFDILKLASYYKGKVIFVTAYEHYALQAIKYSALDYLLKPIDPQELKQALEKVYSDRSKPVLTQQLQTWQANQSRDQLDKKMVLSDAEAIYMCRIGDIIYCSSDRNYTSFFLVDGREILISQPLKSYEMVLPQEYFFRVHRSYLVNLNYLDRFEKKEGGILHLKNGHKLPVATRRKEQLLQLIGRL